MVAANVFQNGGRWWGQLSTNAMLSAVTLTPLVVQGLHCVRAELVGVPAMQRPSPWQGLGASKGLGEVTAQDLGFYPSSYMGSVYVV